MKVLNSIPHDQWPNQRMLGEFLCQKLRTVRRLERVIDEIKRSPDDSPLRDFDFLWSRLQEVLVEEREDANARPIEQSLNFQRSQRTSQKRKPRPYRPKPPQLLRQMQMQLQLHQKLCQRKPMLSHLRKENQKDMESHWMRRKRPRHHVSVSSIRCRQVVFMVQNLPTVIRKLRLQVRKVRATQIQNLSLRLRQQQQPRPWRLLPSLLRQCFSHPRLGWLSGLRTQVLEDIWLPLKLWVIKGMTVPSLMVSPISLMKAFVFLQVVDKRIRPFPLVFKIGMACLWKPVTLSWTHAPWFGRRLDLTWNRMDLFSFGFLAVSHTMSAVVKRTSFMHQGFPKTCLSSSPILK